MSYLPRRYAKALGLCQYPMFVRSPPACCMHVALAPVFLQCLNCLCHMLDEILSKRRSGQLGKPSNYAMRRIASFVRRLPGQGGEAFADLETLQDAIAAMVDEKVRRCGACVVLLHPLTRRLARSATGGGKPGVCVYARPAGRRGHRFSEPLPQRPP